MRVALPLTVVIGAGVGLVLPVGHKGVPATTAPAASNAVASYVPTPTPTSSPTTSMAAVAGETIIPRDPKGHFVASTVVNGVMLPMIVDTGADVVALTVDDARAAHITVDPTTFTVIGRGASGDVRGAIVTLDNVAIAGRTVSGVRGAVIEGLDRSLLGQSYLSRTGGVTMTSDEMRLS